MSKANLEKFSSQASPEVLNELRMIAELEGRQFQSVLDEAFREYIERHNKQRPRQNVLVKFAKSLKEFDEWYRELPK